MSQIEIFRPRPKAPKIERRGRPPKVHHMPPEPMSGVLWKRIIDYGHLTLADKRLTTELGRLYWQRVLTTTQVVAGFRVAEIYGKFENSQGFPRRNVRSPAYDGSYRGSSDNPKWAIDARADWRKLHIAMPPYQLRSELESLCVDNLCVNPTHHDAIRRALDRIAVAFEISADRKKQPAPLHFNAHINGSK